MKTPPNTTKNTPQNKSAFIQRLRRGQPLLLDGGLSNQLEAQGADLNNPLWSASLLKDNPRAIIDAHKRYLQAGADCLISASYQASEKGFESTGLSAEQARALIGLSVTLAQTAINEFMPTQSTERLRPLIAASIGPYGACIADGSEYHGNYGISDATLAAFHRSRLRLLDNSDADILACETIPSYQEARVLHRLLLSVKTPAWISFSCQDGQRTNDGTPIEACAALFADHPNVVAIGINCTAPQYIDELIPRIRQTAPNKAIVVYPNSGEHFDPVDKTWHGTSTPKACEAAASRWIASGAQLIGGCCRMGPEHIQAMKAPCRFLKDNC